MLPAYSDDAPERAALDATAGPIVVEFGSNECGICRATLPVITAAMATTTVPHVRIQDGKGRRLGRTYAVKLWPTLVLLQDGREVARVVRPQTPAEITDALQKLTGPLG